jgi:glycerate-2-kinase
MFLVSCTIFHQACSDGYIKNKAALIENGQTDLDRKARRLAIESLEYAINAVDPKHVIAAKITLKEDILQVEACSFDLLKFKNIYVVGGGKASGSMAEVLEEILGNRITLGVVNVPYGCASKTSRITLHQARHPIPDEAGVEGSRQMLELAQKADATTWLSVWFLAAAQASCLIPERNTH